MKGSAALNPCCALRAPALALWLLFTPPVCDAIDTIFNTPTWLRPANIGGFISPAQAQRAALAKSQSDALDAYNNALSQFKAILRERRAQIALNGLSALLYAPPANAQNSDTPFNDVVALATAIARARGLDAAHAEVAGRISLGIFFAETNGIQNMGNARSNKYKGSLQTGVSEDDSGQKRWAAIKKSIAAFDPTLIARDDKEEARAGNLDHRYNHWTAVRDGLMNAHADVFPHIPAIVKALPNPIDQMRLFELIQIIPSPTKSALNSGNLSNYKISDPTIMGFLRNNSIFSFGQADRAKTSATFREILNAMWLFDSKFERALSKFNEIKAQKRG